MRLTPTVEKTGYYVTQASWYGITTQLSRKSAMPAQEQNTKCRNELETSYTIWYYSKSDIFLYNPVYGELSENHINNFYKYKDDKGVYGLDNLRSPNPRPNLTYDYKGYKPHRNGWAVSKEKMEELDKAGLLQFPKSYS